MKTTKTFWQLKQISSTGQPFYCGLVWYDEAKAQDILSQWQADHPLCRFELEPAEADRRLQRLHGVA